MATERKAEEVDSKEAMLMKSVKDSYTLENQKNSCHDTKMTQPARGDKGKGAWGCRRVWLVAAVGVVILAGVGAGVGIASAPDILHQLGFTSKGVAKNSYASRLMSSTSQANNHTVPEDSWVSWLQKAGQKGLNTEHHAYFVSMGAIAGAMVGVALVLMFVMMSYGARRCRQ